MSTNQAGTRSTKPQTTAAKARRPRPPKAAPSAGCPRAVVFLYQRERRRHDGREGEEQASDNRTKLIPDKANDDGDGTANGEADYIGCERVLL